MSSFIQWLRQSMPSLSVVVVVVGVVVVVVVYLS